MALQSPTEPGCGILRRVTLFGSIPRLATLALAAALLTACSTPAPSRPVTPDDAIKTAITDVGFDSAEELFRGDCGDRTCVLVADATKPQRIALIVLLAAAPYRVEASTTGEVGDEPGTLDEMGTDTVEFVYGRINDARISTLELDLVDGGRASFEVAAPGYAIAYPAERGPVQGWHFLDAGGRRIHEQEPG